MRKLLFVWISVCTLMVGCNNEADGLPDISGNYELLVKNEITEVQSVYTYVIDGKIWCHGLRKYKEWIAIFDANTGNFIKEWYGTDYSNFAKDGYSFYSSFQHPLLVSNDSYAFIKDEHLICYLNKNGQIEYQELDSEILNIPNLSLNSNETIPVKGEGWLICINDGSCFYHLLGFDGKLKVENIHIRNKNEIDICAGRQGNDLWLGLRYENQSFEEIIITESYDWNKKIYEGYGEYEEYNICGFYFNNNNIVETQYGFAVIPFFYKINDDIITSLPSEIGSLDYVWIINNGKLIEVSVQDPQSITNWYEDCILVNNEFVVSSDGKILCEGYFPDDVYPISYTEYIEIRKNIICRNCGSSENYTQGWCVTLDFVNDYPDNSRFIYTIIEETTTELVYRCDIINYDGSKAQVIFMVDLCSGKITYAN